MHAAQTSPIKGQFIIDNKRRLLHIINITADSLESLLTLKRHFGVQNGQPLHCTPTATVFTGACKSIPSELQ